MMKVYCHGESSWFPSTSCRLSFGEAAIEIWVDCWSKEQCGFWEKVVTIYNALEWVESTFNLGDSVEGVTEWHLCT
jgi:hypothetical protein